MSFQEMGDAAILRELGERLKRERLDQNLTQADLGKRTGISRRTIQKTEEGEVSTLATLIALLRGLGKLDQLDLLLPEPPLSPVQLLKLRGKTRKRASKATSKQLSRSQNATSQVRERPEWQWGE